jgi:leader peptidase (prepilin peptidase)/N-methyltransferase
MTIPFIAWIVAYGALAAAFILLLILCIIDFRVRLLPNKYVFPFALLAVVFHAALNFSLIPREDMLIGGVFGYGLLWGIRAAGSWYYKQEALGLGDVKLMGAAGLWLGMEHLLLAITLGASVSVLHGLVYAGMTKQSLRRLEIPAGPGLIAGIAAMLFWMVKDILL